MPERPIYQSNLFWFSCIPGELSRENMISSHAKITCYFHMWKDHHCYCYIIYCTFPSKKLLKWNGLVFHWCLYKLKIEHYMGTWRCKISLLVLKIISGVRVSVHVTSSIYSIYSHNFQNKVNWAHRIIFPRILENPILRF